eukprot:scaffold38351_cov63-Phaeocystis_antarctica.AAC.18
MDEAVWHALAADRLLTDAGDHLRDVDEGTLGAARGHGEGRVEEVELRLADLARLRPNVGELAVDERLERLLSGAAWRGLECAALKVVDLLLAERGALPDEHRFLPVEVGPRGGGGAVVAQQDGEEAVLLPVAEPSLVHDAADQLRVLEAHVAVVGAHVQRRWLRLGHVVALVGPLAVEHAEDLLAAPQLDRLEDAGGRQLDMLRCVAQVGALPCELVTREEDVLASDQVACRDEVLRRRDDHLAVTRRHEVIVHAQQVTRLGPCLLRLRQVQVHLVAVEVRVVRCADALVEAQRAPLKDASAVRHDREPMQRRLPVEEHHVFVVHVPLDHVANLELRGDAPTVSELDTLDVVGAGPDVRPVEDEAPQLREVLTEDALRVGEHACNVHGHSELIDLEVGIWRDHSTPREVDPLAAQVAAEAALLALESLREGADRLLEVLPLCAYTGHGGTIKELPVIRHVGDSGLAALQGAADDAVHSENLRELHGKVVLVGSCGACVDRGADGHGRHEQPVDEQVLGPTVDSGHVEQL